MSTSTRTWWPVSGTRPRWSRRRPATEDGTFDTWSRSSTLRSTPKGAAVSHSRCGSARCGPPRGIGCCRTMSGPKSPGSCCTGSESPRAAMSRRVDGSPSVMLRSHSCGGGTRPRGRPMGEHPRGSLGGHYKVRSACRAGTGRLPAASRRLAAAVPQDLLRRQLRVGSTVGREVTGTGRCVRSQRRSMRGSAIPSADGMQGPGDFGVVAR